MSYKALLFCPDEKIVRAVTQVLSELDFTVEPAADVFNTAKKLADEHFDALVAPTNAPAWTIDLFDGDRHLGGSSQAAAVAGFPLITVPAGFVADLLPIGLTFMGPALSEPTLLKLAYAFEQADPVRRPPRFIATTLDLP